MARKHQSTHPTGFTILVVDDRPETLDSTRALLEREGHTVLTALGGKEALTVFRPGEIHLLIVDYMMPHMNGEELIRAIRERDMDVQILLQTGYAGEKPAREMLRTLDIQGYHDKPDGPDALLLWVDVALKASLRLQAVRETEGLKMQVRLKEEALANLCHEMRTPLQIIGGYREMLLDHTDPARAPDVCQELNDIQRNTQTLEFLIADFLYFVQLEAGAQVVAPEALGLASLAAAVEDCIPCLFPAPEVSVNWQVGSTLPAIWSDRNILLVVLRHLLLDAVQSDAERDTIPTHITISATHTAGADHLALQVTVASQDKPEIPARPDRAAISEGAFCPTLFASGNTVIQLAQRFVGLLAGEITIEQRTARETRYTLTLPLAARHASAAQTGFPDCPRHPAQSTSLAA